MKLLTDEEIIEKVMNENINVSNNFVEYPVNILRVLVRYTRWLERAKTINEVFEEIEKVMVENMYHKVFYLSDLVALKQRLLGGE